MYLSHIVDNEEINILAMFSVTLDFHLVFPADSKFKGILRYKAISKMHVLKKHTESTIAINKSNDYFQLKPSPSAY